jgi:hypothetical protein
MKMKPFYLIVILFILCSSTFKINPCLINNYYVECYNITNSDYIDLKVWSDAKKYNATKAEKNAIHAVLYSGVSGSGNCITQKPILTSEEARISFKKIERKFFSKKGNWKLFIKSSTFIKDKTPSNYYIVSVSKLQLLNFLIEKKVIKSLNNGF